MRSTSTTFQERRLDKNTRVAVPLPGGITQPVTAHTDYRTYIRTYNNTHWVIAQNGGGSTMGATQPPSRLWETFYITDLNGDWLLTGDKVTLKDLRQHPLPAGPANGGGAGRSHS